MGLKILKVIFVFIAFIAASNMLLKWLVWCAAHLTDKELKRQELISLPFLIPGLIVVIIFVKNKIAAK